MRLAHYQHNQYFYDLCDRAGLIVWVEINEIMATGGVSEDLSDNHQGLNQLCHSLDSARPTTISGEWSSSAGRCRE